MTYDELWLLPRLTCVIATRCWRFTGYHNADGYGRYQNGRVHRLAYRLWVGPIPKGLEIDHLCGVRDCCNPDHLEAVTHAENVRRGRAGRPQAARIHCPQGHEYTDDNTYTHNGKRQCKTCNLERSKARYLAKGID